MKRDFIAYDATSRPGAKKWRKLPSQSEVRKKVVQIDPNELLYREKYPTDIERRVNYFINMIRSGQPVPPILVWKLPTGRFKVYDGHARGLAFQRLHINKIPVIVLEKPPEVKSISAK